MVMSFEVDILFALLESANLGFFNLILLKQLYPNLLPSTLLALAKMVASYV
jgi:hypothetical protein